MATLTVLQIVTCSIFVRMEGEAEQVNLSARLLHKILLLVSSVAGTCVAGVTLQLEADERPKGSTSGCFDTKDSCLQIRLDQASSE